MDPITLLVLGGAALLALALNNSEEEPSQTERTRDEIQRIGDATIDTMRQTSSNFREHIDRETRQ